MWLLIDDHPLLDLRAFVTVFPAPLGDLETAGSVCSLLSHDAAAPMQRNDEVRTAIRDLLRHGGFKPTGRSKPASEYLIKAALEGKLGSINLAVDACNAVSLHSGLPISVVDLDRVHEPLRVAIADAGSRYVFNPSGQLIDIGGLLCLMDSEGPCACAVKDAQRTKTSEKTRRTLSVIWGTSRLPGRTEMAEAWYHQLLTNEGANIQRVLA